MEAGRRSFRTFTWEEIMLNNKQLIHRFACSSNNEPLLACCTLNNSICSFTRSNLPYIFRDPKKKEEKRPSF